MRRDQPSPVLRFKWRFVRGPFAPYWSDRCPRDAQTETDDFHDFRHLERGGSGIRHLAETPAATDAPTRHEVLTKISAMAPRPAARQSPQVDRASVFVQRAAIREAEPAAALTVPHYDQVAPATAAAGGVCPDARGQSKPSNLAQFSHRPEHRRADRYFEPSQRNATMRQAACPRRSDPAGPATPPPDRGASSTWPVRPLPGFRRATVRSARSRRRSPRRSAARR